MQGLMMPRGDKRILTSKRKTERDMQQISPKFCEEVEKFRLKHRDSILLDDLRAELGSRFRQDVRVFVTHPF